MPEEDLPEEILYEWGDLVEDLPIRKVKEILCDRYPNHLKAICEWALWEAAELYGRGDSEALLWR
jgi:hypothetical protein